jgi:hypothetical protein
MKSAYKILVGKPEGKIPLGRPRRIWDEILNLLLKKKDGKTWTRFIWLRVRIVGGVL